MSNFYSDTYEASMADYTLQVKEAELAIQRAALSGDVAEGVAASRQRAYLLAEAEKYHAQAVEHSNSMRPAAQSNRYGLSDDEVAIADGISGSDPKLSKDERQRIYAENKNKLRHMRATGQYRDDQGTVSR